MKKISSRLDSIKPSATLAFTQKAADLKSQGLDIVAFSAGEPDFETPLHIVNAAKKALDDGLTRYTPVTGTIALKTAVAQSSSDCRKVPCDTKQVIIGVGAKHVLYNYFMAVLDEGDEVIIPSPYWVSYPDQVCLAGGTPVFVETRPEDNWTLTAEQLEKAVTPKTKVVLINSPSNPTGGVAPKAILEKLVDKALELDLLIISDEIYRDIIYDGVEFHSPLTLAKEKKENVFVVDGVSKTFAMTGWRIGWGIGDPAIISAMGKIQGQSTSNATSIAQAASVIAVTKSMDFLDDWNSQYVERRDIMIERLNAMDGVTCRTPQGAFYVFPNVEPLVKKLGKDKNDVDLATWLLEEALVATVPGTPFGAPGYLRLSYATSKELINKGLDRIEEALKKL
ncbi:MAG: pyridoxal phosphate-dependent aminotransferase [Deltaproteobacteria bacterium]|nr:pyridoxal phosphate-dependent aminotransferase [Deltaproteobacteria bacterium]